jgi:hypothetical protein
MQLIAKGDASGVTRAGRKHLDSAQLYAVDDPEAQVRGRWD